MTVSCGDLSASADRSNIPMADDTAEGRQEANAARDWPTRVPPEQTPTLTTAVPLRWSDLDLLGHVNNARVLTLLEEAGFAFHDALSREYPGLLPDNGRVVARWEVDYVRPILRGADLEVTTTRLSCGRSSYRLGFVGEQDGIVAVKAVSVLVRVDSEGRAIPLSEAEVLLLNTAIT